MSDFIRREDVVEALYQAIRTTLTGTFTDSMSLAIAMANNLPSAEPERKKGEWIWDNKTAFERCRCSECGYYRQLKYPEPENYCPNCGAEMESEDVNND